MHRIFAAGIIISLAGFSVGRLSAQTPPPLTSFTPTACDAEASPFGGGVSLTSASLCTMVAQTSVDPVSGLLGVTLDATNDSFEAISSSGGRFGLVVYGYGGVNGTTDESATATYTGTIPLSWDFTATSSDGGNLAWWLIFSFYGPAGESQIVEGDLGNYDLVSGTQVSGTSSISFSDASVTGYSINLEVLEAQSSAGTISVTVPQDSLGIASSAPEPASIALLSAGVFALILFALRSRAQHLS
jgi:hypothetical protein